MSERVIGEGLDEDRGGEEELVEGGQEVGHIDLDEITIPDLEGDRGATLRDKYRGGGANGEEEDLEGVWEAGETVPRGEENGGGTRATLGVGEELEPGGVHFGNDGAEGA